jgi:translation initiation factor IF-2
MSEIVQLPRAMKASIEFNVSKDTLVEFLLSKGFGADEMHRDFKLTEAMYRVAQAEFQQDKAAKAKAQQVELSKGSAETKKKKDEKIFQ